MTSDELDAFRLELLLQRRSTEEAPGYDFSREERDELDAVAAELDKHHAANVRWQGRARAELARWNALMRLAVYLQRCEAARREKAMHDAIEALERARLAERGEVRWLRIAAWLARRVDEAAQRMGHHTRIVTRIDFAATEEASQFRESLEADDVSAEEEERIPW